MPRVIKKKQGSTFFWGDWLNDRELNSCSRAARSLWMDMLCVMFFQTPQGVLASFETYLEYRYPDPRMANLIAEEEYPLFMELIEKGVCSLGKDMPGPLPAEGIVSRKMYGKWLAENDKSEKCRIAVNIRWANERKSKTRKIGCPTNAYENDTRRATERIRKGYGQVVDQEEHGTFSAYARDTQALRTGCSAPACSPSITYPPTDLSSPVTDSLPVVHPTQPEPEQANPRTALPAVTAIGDVLGSILPERAAYFRENAPPGTKQEEMRILLQLMELTGKNPALGSPAIRKQVTTLLQSGGRADLNRLLDTLRDCPGDRAAYAQAALNHMAGGGADHETR